ncbi:hypothetical protein PsorP6_001276 [Peronosclerospora sorghi]|uniref:Uncharacterized protein n=1 Tax=Peronosclerospora sorghi TaxID=230839 RepID=A0ACC0WUI3_9STRA|nr:hypothetical protein PsorP6_001276 [Peronosclerospora sorghi]
MTSPSNSALCYRRKVSIPTNNEKLEQQPTQLVSKYLISQREGRQTQQLMTKALGSGKCRTSVIKERFKSNPLYLKQQPAILKQLFWKAKVVQTIPAVPVLSLPQHGNRNHERKNIDEDQGEEEYAMEQRQGRKTLASAAEDLDVAKNKVFALVPSSAEYSVAGSSSQETQSGSEDEVVFLPFRDLIPSVQPSAGRCVKKKQEEGVCIPLVPSDEMTPKGNGLKERTSTRHKQRQKYRLRQKQKRIASKKQKRFHGQKQYREETGSTQKDQNATKDISYPSTDLTSNMDESVCCVGVSQLKEVAPFILVGDVVCPVVAASNKQHVSAKQRDANGESSDVAVMEFRQHLKVTTLDRCEEMKMHNRESFVVDNSGFDAASSYDFLKHRTFAAFLLHVTSISYSLLTCACISRSLCRF